MNEYLHDISQAIAVLNAGGTILYPTDTVWGIGCDATNDEAVRRVYALKQRDDAKALVTLVGSMSQLEGLAGKITDNVAHLLADNSRPTTIIYDAPQGLSRLVVADNGSAAIRLTREDFSALLCRTFGKPLVSTSANISGHPAPQRFDQIDPAILAGVDYVCLSRRDEDNGPPSRIVKLNADGSITCIRD
jgi:L-threonylcarbamoyladenylate synthase